MDYEVVIFFGWVAGAGIVSFKGAVGNGEVVGINVLFSFEFKCGHKENLFWFINVMLLNEILKYKDSYPINLQFF